jgi:hypothetical protein
MSAASLLSLQRQLARMLLLAANKQAPGSAGQQRDQQLME